MIYLFHGSDSEKARAKAFEWMAVVLTIACLRRYRDS